MNKLKNNKIALFMLITIVVVFITFIGIIIYILFFKNDLKQIKTDVEINSKVKLFSVINKPRNVSIITKNAEIDTTTLGVQRLKIEYKNKFNKKEIYNFSVNIVDTKKPVIESKNEITVDVYTPTLDIKVNDNSKEEIKPIIKGNYDLNNIGEYKITVKATDSSGNTSSKNISIKVVAPKYKTTGYYSVKTDEAWYSIALRDNDYVEYEINPCHGMGCGLFYMDGRYKVEGNKLILNIDHHTDDTLEREEETTPTEMIMVIKDENTIIYNDLIFTYSDKQW